MRDNPIITLEIRQWRPGRAGFVRMAVPAIALGSLGLVNLLWRLNLEPTSRAIWSWIGFQFLLMVGVYGLVTLWAITTVVAESRGEQALWQDLRVTPLPPPNVTASLATALCLRLLPGLVALALLMTAANHVSDRSGLPITALLLGLFVWMGLAQVAFTVSSLLGTSLEQVRLWPGLGVGALNLIFDLMLVGLLVQSVALPVLALEGTRPFPSILPPRLTPPGEK